MEIAPIMARNFRNGPLAHFLSGHQMAILDKLKSTLEPVIAAMGYEVVDIEYQPQRHARVLRVFIDRPEGITLSDCESVSHQITGVLDVEDVIPGAYSLEVSSPGLDRRLTKARDFERFAGSRARIELIAPRNGRRRFTGTLDGFAEGQVLLEVDGERCALPLAEIGKARLVPEI
jgi:ribosome maturation factor RimP